MSAPAAGRRPSLPDGLLAIGPDALLWVLLAPDVALRRATAPVERQGSAALERRRA